MLQQILRTARHNQANSQFSSGGAGLRVPLGTRPPISPYRHPMAGKNLCRSVQRHVGRGPVFWLVLLFLDLGMARCSRSRGYRPRFECSGLRRGVVRACIAAIPSHQSEGAAALGLTKVQNVQGRYPAAGSARDAASLWQHGHRVTGASSIVSLVSMVIDAFRRIDERDNVEDDRSFRARAGHLLCHVQYHRGRFSSCRARADDPRPRCPPWSLTGHSRSKILPLLLEAAKVTITATAAGFVIAAIVGLLLEVGRRVGGRPTVVAVEGPSSSFVEHRC